MSVKSDFLALLALSTFALANPVLSALGKGPTFFLTHNASPADVVWFATALYLIPALALTLISAGLRLASQKAASIFLGVSAGVLVGCWVMAAVSKTIGVAAIAVALVVALFVSWAYVFVPRLREFLKIVGVLSPLVVISFLFFTPVKNFLLPDDPAEITAKAGEQTPIVFLLFDELSLAAITTLEGRIDAERLPNFARLERLATWYYDTTTVSSRTEKAVPALLSGMRASEESFPILSEFPRNLFTVFGNSHTVTAMESHTRLCPESLCAENASSATAAFNPRKMYRDVSIIWMHAILPADLAERYLPSVSTKWGNFGQNRTDTRRAVAPNRLKAARLRWRLDTPERMGQYAQLDHTRRFGRFIDAISESRGASLVYLHFGLPHNPFRYLPDGTTYNGQSTPGESFTTWADDQILSDQAILRYAMQVEYVDLLLGEALDVLERSGRMEETLLVVVSDHGIAFTPGEDRRVPSVTTLADIARVPLFIKYPGQTSGKRDIRKVETIDIFPTIAAATGFFVDEGFEGQSLISDNWQPVERSIIEAGDSIRSFDQAIDFTIARQRIYNVIEPGKSALGAIGSGSGKRFIGSADPETAGFSEQFKLRLFETNCYDEVTPANGFVPARLTGNVTGAVRGMEFMVSVNGTVAGSGVVINEEGFVSIMLDPRNFVAGENDIHAYIIQDRDIIELPVSCDMEDPRGIGN